jgi:hypothetical protein
LQAKKIGSTIRESAIKFGSTILESFDQFPPENGAGNEEGNKAEEEKTRNQVKIFTFSGVIVDLPQY